MLVEILGGGCSKCESLEKNARQACEDLALEARFEKITDFVQIAQKGVMQTPALIIDGTLLGSGKVLTSEQIKTFLKTFKA